MDRPSGWAARALGTALLALSAIAFEARPTFAQSCRAPERPTAVFAIHLRQLTFPQTPALAAETLRVLESPVIWPCQGQDSTGKERHDRFPQLGAILDLVIDRPEISERSSPVSDRIASRTPLVRLDRPPRV